MWNHDLTEKINIGNRDHWIYLLGHISYVRKTLFKETLVGSIQATTELTGHRVGAATVHVELIWASLVKQAKKEKSLNFCVQQNLKGIQRKIKKIMSNSRNT